MPIIGVIASSMKGAPSAPTSVSATDVGTGRAFNNGAATVSFTPGAGAAATSFTATSNPGGFTGTASSSPITVTGLQSGVSYTFTVTGTNASGTGPASAPSNSITATTVPQAPTIGTATAGNAQATVAFTANATGGSTITGFTATSSPGSITGTNTASPITVTGLTNGTAYTFTVTATNVNGTSLPSAASNSVTPVAPVFNYWSAVGGPTNTSYFESAASNSVANYYSGTMPLVGQNQPYLLFSYNKSGGVNWQRSVIPTSTPFYLQEKSVKVSPNGNIIVNAHQLNSNNTNEKCYVASFAPNGTVNWQFDYGPDNARFNDVGQISVDSSNNIYVVGSAQVQAQLYKIDSNGNVVWTRRNWQLSNSVTLAASTTTATRVYTFMREIFAVGKSTVLNATLARFNSTTGAQEIRQRIGNTGGIQYNGRALATNTASNDDIIFCGNIPDLGFGSIIRFNSDLGFISARQINTNLIVNGVTTDASGNIYAVAATGAIIYIFKWNNLLELQWQRSVTPTNGGSMNAPDVSYDNTNDKVIVAVTGNLNGWAFALPTNGSGTGSYTVGSITIAYAASSLNITNATFTPSGQTVYNETVTVNRGSIGYLVQPETRTVTTTTF